MIIVDCAGLRIEVSNVQIAFLDAAIKINQFIDYTAIGCRELLLQLARCAQPRRADGPLQHGRAGRD